jgi:hypothetical protein
LNKQYSKKEYEELVPKIIKHMKANNEWGEFFPHNLSPFAYNETVAQNYFPMSKGEVLERGWSWYEDVESKSYKGPEYEMPNDIKDVPDDMTRHILICEVSDKLYKIIPQELEFYRKINLPIPRRCPEQRHKDRMTLVNPRRLWERECNKCNKAIQSTYAPERPEKIYCEECYLKEVY